MAAAESKDAAVPPGKARLPGRRVYAGGVWSRMLRTPRDRVYSVGRRAKPVLHLAKDHLGAPELVLPGVNLALGPSQLQQVERLRGQIAAETAFEQ